jgi:hypothetical protein
MVVSAYAHAFADADADAHTHTRTHAHTQFSHTNLNPSCMRARDYEGPQGQLLASIRLMASNVNVRYSL